MKTYIAYTDQQGANAWAFAYYNPAPEGIENLVPEGIFFDEEIPEPETLEGCRAKRMIKLEGEGAPLIYYTYEPLPEPEETQLEKAKTRIAALESADLDNKEMIATLYELTTGGAV